MSAVISPCGLYRYQLERTYDITLMPKGAPLVWMMANPSTADAENDDPTIRKCRGFSERLGYDRFIVINVMAGRATKPKDLLAMSDPVGPMNGFNIRQACLRANTLICAWGNAIHPKLRHHMGTALQSISGPTALMCFGYTADRQPRHPLMLSYSTPLEFYKP